MSAGRIVVLDALVWAVWSTAVGYALHRVPAERLAHDGPLTRIRPWEREGRVYEHLRIRRWKDLLPDLGTLFRGGVAKRSLATRDPAALRRLAAETRRAELVHWAVPAATPLFALWSPPWLLAAMAAYAVAANLPCLVVQRYNRGRLERILGDGAHAGVPPEVRR